MESNTMCGSCGNYLDDRDTKETFILCPKCHKFYPVGNKKSVSKRFIKPKSNVNIVKKEVEKMSDEENTNKPKRGAQKKEILALLEEGKTVEEIAQSTGYKKAHVNGVKKKFFDTK